VQGCHWPGPNGVASGSSRRLMARLGPRGKTLLAHFLHESAIQTVAFDDEHAAVVLDAFSRFGKGRHPACW
jgi:uncharacterized protein with PIN domain